MEFFNRAWATIRAQFDRLPASTKWLIGSMLIIFMLVAFLVMEYAAKSDTVPIMPVSADRVPAVLVRLQSAGIKAENKVGQLYVPSDKRDEAYAILAESDLISGNAAAAFDDLVTKQSWFNSNATNARTFLLAKQKVLGQIIAKMAGVRSADVILSTPENTGFGATHVHSSASVNVVMRGSNAVNKKLVEAIAGLVSGSIAEMRPEDVVVIDANQGKQFTSKKAGEGFSGDLLEQYQQLEQYQREKITEVLGYIPGVIVAVNVQVDETLDHNVVETQYSPEPLKRERTEETETRDFSSSAEPGVKPNAGMTIDSPGAAGTSTSKTSKTENEFGDTKVIKVDQRRMAGQTAKKISVTVNVPQSFFVAIYKKAKGEAPDAPDPKEDDADFTKLKTERLAEIESQVKPLISTESAGVVTVHMIPDPRMLLAASGTTAATGGNMLAWAVENTWIKPVGLALLGAASLLLMFGMIRKSTTQQVMPSIQELAGVPPPLPVEEDLIGEAEATEASMAGVELNESDIRTRKIAEQIADMVKTNPTEAAGLFNRWIKKEG